MSLKIPLTLIIADCASTPDFKDCLQNIASWFPRKIIVSNNSILKDQLPQGMELEFIYHNSNSTYEMWRRGIEESKTQWNVLITSSEIITGRLKKSIENKISNSLRLDGLFKFKKKAIFFKKVLKYPLEWPDEFPSGLVHVSEIGKFKLPKGFYSSSSFLDGELVHFGKTSLKSNLNEITRLADIEADNLFKSSETKNLVVLIFKSFWKSGLSFFKNLLLKKAIKEGYEGIAFCVLGAAIQLFGYLRYYEKYFREGKAVESDIKNIKNILIIKLGGAGDIILATPIIKNLKKLIPQANLHVLVLEDVASLLNNNPHIKTTTFINFDDSKQKIKNIARSLDKYNIDLAVNLQSTNFSSKVLKRVSSRWKINRSYYFRDKNTDVLVGFENTYRSVIERDFDVLRSIGLNPVEKKTEVFLDGREIHWAKEFFSLNGLSQNKNTVVVHPCSSLKIRSWGMDNFTILCKKLVLEGGYQIIINCSPNELDSVAVLKNIVPEVCLFSGSLRELLSLINESVLFIGNDSGPAQFSAALNISTITLNGPSISSLYRDPDLFQDKHYTFNKEVHCRDLFHTQCMAKIDPRTNHPVCDEMICLDFSVDEVIAKAIELMR